MTAREAAYNIITGKLVAHLRKQRNMSQRDLAEKLQVAQSTLSRIERGEIPPDIWQFRALAATFGMSEAQLLQRVDAAIEQARKAAQANTQRSDDSAWEAVVAVAGVVGLGALILFAIQSLFGDDA